MSTAQNVIDKVRRLINDEVGDFASAQAWSDTELLQWLSDAQRAIVVLKPESNSTTNVFLPQAGRPRQRLDEADACKLIRIEATTTESGAG